MNRYFYTFGSDLNSPYQNGWVEIHEERWAEMNPEHTWAGWRCYEIIK